MVCKKLFILFACFVAIQAQCPANVTSIFIISDRTINVPLTVPLCLACRFLNNMGDRISFTDGTWTRGMGAGSLSLVDGSFNGNVSLSSTSDTTFLTLTYPDAVVNVGDVLVCSSTQASAQNILTIGPFNFLNPIVLPNDTVNITEGSMLMLTCSDPGNTGTTRYVWMDSAGNALTAIVTSSPLILTLNNIQQASSGLYICRSTKPNDLPDEIRETSIQVNVEAGIMSPIHMSTAIDSSTHYYMPSSMNDKTSSTTEIPHVSSLPVQYSSTEIYSMYSSITAAVTSSSEVYSSSTGSSAVTVTPTATVTGGAGTAMKSVGLLLVFMCGMFGWVFAAE